MAGQAAAKIEGPRSFISTRASYNFRPGSGPNDRIRALAWLLDARPALTNGTADFLDSTNSRLDLPDEPDRMILGEIDGVAFYGSQSATGDQMLTAVYGEHAATTSASAQSFAAHGLSLAFAAPGMSVQAALSPVPTVTEAAAAAAGLERLSDLPHARGLRSRGHSWSTAKLPRVARTPPSKSHSCRCTTLRDAGPARRDRVRLGSRHERVAAWPVIPRTAQPQPQPHRPSMGVVHIGHLGLGCGAGVHRADRVQRVAHLRRAGSNSARRPVLATRPDDKVRELAPRARHPYRSVFEKRRPSAPF